MKFPQQHTLKQIATIINCEFVGSDDFPVFGMNEIHVVRPGDIVFVDHPKYYDKALESAATIVLINKKVACPEGKALLISDDPFRDFNKLSQHFNSFNPATKLVSESAKIGKNTIIQPNAFIGNNVIIGDDCIIHANVVINDATVIGNNVIIQSGTILGSDAFYYKNRPTGFDKLLSCGRVVIEDNVEIGATCTIDRGVTGDTTIKEGTKIDNQVQIAHNVELGENTGIAGCSAIAGSTRIGKNCTIAGAVGIIGHLTIVDNVHITVRSLVTKSILKAGSYSSGTSMQETQAWRRNAIRFSQLDSMAKRLNKLERKLD